jgi:hypothetical protein
MEKGSWTEHIKQIIRRGKAASSTLLRNKTLISAKDIKMH